MPHDFKSGCYQQHAMIWIFSWLDIGSKGMFWPLWWECVRECVWIVFSLVFPAFFNLLFGDKMLRFRFLQTRRKTHETLLLASSKRNDQLDMLSDRNRAAQSVFTWTNGNADVRCQLKDGIQFHFVHNSMTRIKSDTNTLKNYYWSFVHFREKLNETCHSSLPLCCLLLVRWAIRLSFTTSVKCY